MGKKSKSDKKHKGPKGKKARAKAKLDRQWGEIVDEEEQNQARIRHGKSRILKRSEVGSSRLNSDHVPSHEEHPSSRREPTLEEDASESSEDETINDGALELLMASIQKKSRKDPRKRPASNSDSEESSEAEKDHSKFDEEMSEEEESEHEDTEVDNHISFGADAVDGGVDPFTSHFAFPLPENNADLSCIRTTSTMAKVPTPFLDKSLELQLPSSIVDQLKSSNHDNNGERLYFQEEGKKRLVFNRKVLEAGWKKSNGAVVRKNPESATATREPRALSALQSVIYSSMADYRDLMVTAVSRKNRVALHNVLYLHILNHVLTSRGRIQRNNKRVKEIEASKETLEADTEVLRDQGYTRPTVLVLLPTRGTCQTIVQSMLRILGDSTEVENLDRFDTEYGPPPSEDEESDEARRLRRKAVLESKGAEWQELFGDETNDDDDFKLGIAITPKVAKRKKQETGGGLTFKLYSDFYKSDIIIASPLGLKMSIESGDGESDSDFLSSIEVCVVTYSEVLLMQNWDHVNTVMELLNKQPEKNNDTDFSRVRHYLLGGKAEHWRQLIVLSQLADAQIFSTFKRFSKSIEGHAKLKRRTPLQDASLCNVMVRVKQVFQRVESNSFANQGSDRLRYFEDRVLPQIRRLKQKHTMIFIPSYFDFIAVRNLLLKKEMDFVSVTEYARVSEVSRGRARFLQGRKPIMLYTGRCHFFSRHTIKGTRHLIFFGIPEQPDFYSGMVNNLSLSLDGVEMDSPMSCLALFTKYDAHALERIVGNSHCERMIKGGKTTFLFAS